MLDNYFQFKIDGKDVYIRKDGINPLKDVTTVLFDCDGVLIDARESYDLSIRKTVSYISREILKTPVSEDEITDKVIYGFRKSGGFNNDWDTTYVILLYLFTRIPKKVVDIFSKFFKLNDIESVPRDVYKRISEVKKLLSDVEISDESLLNISNDLLLLSKKADIRGIDSILEVLPKIDDENAFVGFKKIMSYPDKVGVSMITTLFEEFFLGSDLFSEKYGFPSEFLDQFPGLVSSEVPILTENTMNLLSEMFGESNFGIVSGRAQLTARYTLGNLLNRFNSDLIFFIEDEKSSSLKKSDSERIDKISKPHPFALLKVAENTKKSGRILYIGDSMEDLIMVDQSNCIMDRFITAGICGYSHDTEELVKMFKEHGTFLIIESVNDIPKVFERIMREDL